MNPEYNHAEAFCLMRYASKDGRVSEWIWNSRDGVTPFIVTAKDGKTELTHVNWRGDECRPDHVLQPGDRYFGPGTREMAEREAKRRLDSCVGTEYELKGQERAEMEARLVESMVEDADAPWLLTYPGKVRIASSRKSCSEPLDANGKRSRLFYWEEACDCWAPVPFEHDEIPGIFSIDLLSEHGETAVIRLKRFDMSDEEFAALPEV